MRVFTRAAMAATALAAILTMSAPITAQAAPAGNSSPWAPNSFYLGEFCSWNLQHYVGFGFSGQSNNGDPNVTWEIASVTNTPQESIFTMNWHDEGLNGSVEVTC